MNKKEYSRSEKQITWGVGEQLNNWTQQQKPMIFGLYFDDLNMDEEIYWIPENFKFIDVFLNILSSCLTLKAGQQLVKNLLKTQDFIAFDSKLLRVWGLFQWYGFYHYTSRNLSTYDSVNKTVQVSMLHHWLKENGIKAISDKTVLIASYLVLLFKVLEKTQLPASTINNSFEFKIPPNPYAIEKRYETVQRFINFT